MSILFQHKPFPKILHLTLMYAESSGHAEGLTVESVEALKKHEFCQKLEYIFYHFQRATPILDNSIVF